MTTTTFQPVDWRADDFVKDEDPAAHHMFGCSSWCHGNLDGTLSHQVGCRNRPPFRYRLVDQHVLTASDRTDPRLAELVQPRTRIESREDAVAAISAAFRVLAAMRELPDRVQRALHAVLLEMERSARIEVWLSGRNVSDSGMDTRDFYRTLTRATTGQLHWLDTRRPLPEEPWWHNPPLQDLVYRVREPLTPPCQVYKSSMRWCAVYFYRLKNPVGRLLQPIDDGVSILGAVPRQPRGRQRIEVVPTYEERWALAQEQSND